MMLRIRGVRSSRAQSRGAGTDSSRAPLDFARDERTHFMAQLREEEGER
jgi:hypothetical protein